MKYFFLFFLLILVPTTLAYDCSQLEGIQYEDCMALEDIDENIIANIMYSNNSYPDHAYISFYNDPIIPYDAPDRVSKQSSGIIKDAWVAQLSISPSVLFDEDIYVPSNFSLRSDYNYKIEVPKNYQSSTKRDGRIVKHAWLLTTKQKNFIKAKQRIEHVASRLRLPDIVIKEAIALYQRAISIDLTVGRDNLSLTYACVYAAAMIHDLPKTPLEVVFRSEISRHKMLRSYKMLKQELGIRTQTIDPIDILPRFANKLNLSQETITIAMQLASKIKGTRVALGRHPRTLVASIIYVACKLNNEPITQRAIANATGCIEVTIRKRSQEILRHLD